MKRAQRVILEVFGPPALAATIFEIVALVAVREVAALKLFPMFLIFGYLVAGLPSLAFAGILEFAFSKGLGPKSTSAVLLAAMLGMASGLPIDMAIAGAITVRPSAAFFTILGLLVGGAIGLVIRAWPLSGTRVGRPG
jgi:hypothetical protein